MGMLVIVKDWGVFLDKKRNRAKHRQNPRGKPSSVCFPADTFQKDNLKHKAKSTLELFTKETVNVP
jgi:hypothetical protein